MTYAYLTNTYVWPSWYLEIKKNTLTFYHNLLRQQKEIKGDILLIFIRVTQFLSYQEKLKFVQLSYLYYYQQRLLSFKLAKLSKRPKPKGLFVMVNENIKEYFQFYLANFLESPHAIRLISGRFFKIGDTNNWTSPTLTLLKDFFWGFGTY